MPPDDALAKAAAEAPSRPPRNPQERDICERYRQVRAASLTIAAPLSEEDQVVQAMEDASPIKWHLAHTTWFFETFLLKPLLADYESADPVYGYLFNSYYEAAGPRQPRPLRGLITRPPLAEVLSWRRRVDEAMERLIADRRDAGTAALIELGLAHEEQHQELMLMDILALFARSPLDPAYDAAAPEPKAAKDEGGGEGGWAILAGGLVEIGARAGFAFDNERPRHKTWLAPYALGRRLVSNGEYLAFVVDGGYRRASLWHADGWRRVQEEHWTAPLYWRRGDDGAWRQMSLRGLEPLDLTAPVAHLSWFEASAFAAWAGARLPTEAEWESAAASRRGDLAQLEDTLWQWTASAYSPYPGFAPAAGAIGEYNGKFMVGQMALKGGSIATPKGHARPSYRNFFYPHQRWMFAGLRLARDAPGETASFREDVVAGLAAPRKSLPPKWFYDAEGSRLFEAICELPEYYLTRQESALLERIAPEIGAAIPASAILVELGSGASRKTRILLDAAPQLAAYAPVDISAEALGRAANLIALDYPGLAVRPFALDFTRAEALSGLPAGPRVGFFPGSTIGNFAPDEAIALLARLRGLMGGDGRLVVGVDLVKDAATLEAAYDDPQGVTAAFNLNLLVRINRELAGDFRLDRFRHRAQWNRAEGRMEMHLEVVEAHVATAAGAHFAFRAGETIHTENSYKFSEAGFGDLARRAGWAVRRTWTSPPPEFALFLLAAE